MNNFRYFTFLFSVIVLSVLAFATNSCTDNLSFKKASEYNSQLDSTYVYLPDSLAYHLQWTPEEGLKMPSPSEFNNAILIHGYSWFHGWDYRCIISGEKDKKLQMIYRDMNTIDTIYDYIYHEKNLTDGEYNFIAKLIIKGNLLNYPLDLEHGRGKSMIDADTYFISIKEDDFFKTIFWRVTDLEEVEKRSAFRVHQAILKLSDYPLPKPYVKLLSNYNGNINCEIGLSTNALMPDYEVSYKDTYLEKEDSVWHYELFIPTSEIKQLKENLVFEAKFEDGKKIILRDLEIDSSRLSDNR
ncbi:MAG: hypothetical protein IT258_02465 [Saprospiraceae bacterium]|nr:hypothetical protein [Saprospiraceae bacterium]